MDVRSTDNGVEWGETQARERQRETNQDESGVALRFLFQRAGLAEIGKVGGEAALTKINMSIWSRLDLMQDT